MYGPTSVGLRWRKSSHSNAENANCVEIAREAGAVLVRDSKNPDGPALTFSTRSFHAFLTTTRQHS